MRPVIARSAPGASGARKRAPAGAGARGNEGIPGAEAKGLAGDSTRAQILARVRSSQPAPRPLPALPVFPRSQGSLLETFVANLERMGGEYLGAGGDDPSDWIRRRHPDARVVCSATPEVAGTRPITAIAAITGPAGLEDVDVGVVRAAFGVAETGSVLLTESELVVEALGFLPQHLVVLLDPASLVPGLHDAYRDPRFKLARYAVLLSGPSATADIEGVLVRGAQGVRSLTVIGRSVELRAK